MHTGEMPMALILSFLSEEKFGKGISSRFVPKIHTDMTTAPAPFFMFCVICMLLFCVIVGRFGLDGP